MGVRGSRQPRVRRSPSTREQRSLRDTTMPRKVFVKQQKPQGGGMQAAMKEVRNEIDLRFTAVTSLILHSLRNGDRLAWKYGT